MTPEEQLELDLQVERDIRAAKQARAAKKAASQEAARSEAMGGPFTDPEEQRVLDLETFGFSDAGCYPLTILTVGAGAVGWITARRTLLAARPKLSRKWFGVFGPVMWRCGRCGNQIALEKARCETCGQYQKWPKWSTEA